MAYLIIEDFRRGLDRRKLALGAAAGTLVECIDGHITALGEIEKRKAFVPLAFTSGNILDGNADQGLFGLQETASGLTVFGSALAFGTPSTLSQPVLAATLPVTDPVLSYQQLKHPAIVELQAYDRTKHRMTALVWSELYAGSIWAVAQFADGRRFGYFDGALVTDMVAGLILEHLAGQNDLIAEHLKNLVNQSSNYTATRVGSVVTITGGIGEDYDLTKTVDTVGTGDLTLVNTVQPVVPRDGVSAAGSFKVMAGSAGGVAVTAATASITRNGTAPSDGHKMRIGQRVYTFKTTLTTPLKDGEVKIGGSATNALANLRLALSRGGTLGTEHSCVEAHPYVTPGVIAGSVLPLTAAAGETGNSVALLASDLTGIGWTITGATFTGGAGNCISQVKVVSPSGVAVNLLGTAVAWVSDNPTTAAAVAAEINTNTVGGLAHGYTATATDNGVSIFSNAAAVTVPNNYALWVQASGNVCIGDCMFYFTQKGAAAFTVSAINVDAVNLLSAGPFVSSSYASLTEMYAAIADDINDEAGTKGILAKTNDTFLQVSKICTKSTDAALPVYVVVDANGGVVFGTPPDSPLALSVVFPNGVADVIDVAESTNGPFPNQFTITAGPYLGTTVVSVVASGGSGVYTYLWKAAFSGSDTGSIGSAQGSGVFDYKLEPTNTNSANTIFRLRFTDPFGLGPIKIPAAFTAQFVCEVTDSLGKKFITDAIRITFYMQ